MDTLYPKNHVALLIKAPKALESSIEKFQTFFQDFHKFVKDQKDLRSFEKKVSFEVILRENYFHYRIVLSQKLVGVVKALLFSQFKDIDVLEESYPEEPKSKYSLCAEFRLKRPSYFPLKIHKKIEEDPYVVLSAILSKLEHFREGAVIQIILFPIKESWIKKLIRQNFSFVPITMHKIKLFLEKPFIVRASVQYEEEIEKKFASPLFLATVRVLSYSDNESVIKENFFLLGKTLDKFDNGDINELTKSNINTQEATRRFLSRDFSGRKIVLNTEEVAGLFHFPDASLDISNVDKVTAKKVEPPKEIPVGSLLQTPSVSIFAQTNFRSSHFSFGLKRGDRSKHVYVIGKTGMGKSKLIQLLTMSDIHEDKGFCVIDPHGDLAMDILQNIPQKRIQDVIYFNPADSEYPIGFNPLKSSSNETKHQVVTGFIAIFKKLFAHAWTNRLEHMLRFTVLALLEAGDATVIDIVKLLTDITFRQQTIKRIKDPVVKNFWTHEFSSWNEKFDNEAIIPIVNQVGQFIANDYVRNVVGQKNSNIDFYEAMNTGKIVIINLAKGKLGEENASLLGSMIITKIQEAAMARVNISQHERREFYLYVDEFQNFATEAFNQILSEARKFNLSLLIAHQYIDQLSESIRKTAFGNIGSLICFRVGAEDAHFLSNEFAPQITPDDLINLDAREIYVKLSVDGKTSAPFSAKTIDVPKQESNHVEDIIQYTRSHYAVEKSRVEKELFGDESTKHLLTTEEKKSYTSDDTFEEPLIN